MQNAKVQYNYTNCRPRKESSVRLKGLFPESITDSRTTLTIGHSLKPITFRSGYHHAKLLQLQHY
jgi:hypothetical protein